MNSISCIVIVLDALDECDYQNAANTFLNIILRHAPKFPKNFKIFISSRPEPHILHAFDEHDDNIRTILRLHEVEYNIVKADIRHYIDTTLGNILELRREYDDEWPPREVDTLVDRAQSFFDASTLCKYIDDSCVNPVELVEVLAKSTSHRAIGPVDKLYTIIMNGAFEFLEDEDAMARQRLLGVIVFARNPLAMQDLADLLSMTSAGSSPLSIRLFIFQRMTIATWSKYIVRRLSTI